jgi:protein associated with RNAse G/E
VRVVYTKFDGSLHWHMTARYLGEDEFGIWLGTGAGGQIQRGYEPPTTLDEPWVELIPAGQWWTATFNAAPAKTEIYCDIGTPPQWPGAGEVTMADLDLDVVKRRADQQVLIVDQDEFAEHQVRYQYPPDVISEAERAAAWLLDQISSGAEPFASRYHAWLDLVR